MDETTRQSMLSTEKMARELPLKAIRLIIDTLISELERRVNGSQIKDKVIDLVMDDRYANSRRTKDQYRTGLVKLINEMQTGGEQ
jgi:phosphoenolpyruvate carboxylase